MNVCGAIISLMIELHEVAFFHITWDTCFAMMYDFPWCCFWPFLTNTNNFTIICFQFFWYIWHNKSPICLFTDNADNIVYVDEDYEEGDYESEDVSKW